MRIKLAENFRAIFYAPYYATQALGFYGQEGVEIEFLNSSVPGDAVSAILDGKIDVTWGGPMRVMKAHDLQPDSPLVCFCEVVARDPFYLVGRSDGSAFQLADLQHLNFATVSEVPTPWLCLQHDLREQGIDPNALRRAANRTMAENYKSYAAGGSTRCRYSNHTHPWPCGKARATSSTRPTHEVRRSTRPLSPHAALLSVNARPSLA